MSENKQVQDLRHKIIEYGTLRGAMSINRGNELFRENLDAAEKLFREIEADLVVLSASAGEKKSMERLEKFLDAAGGIGFVLAGVDAGDLYAELFPEQYASKSNQEQSTNKELG